MYEYFSEASRGQPSLGFREGLGFRVWALGRES